jgi:DNA-directed RNA polymerase I subunit RPA2
MCAMMVPFSLMVALFLSLKAGSLHGKFIDATPFANSVKEKGSKPTSVVDELGPMLASYGFNHHGTEVLYSGLFGNEMTCEIFIGPVYYQRLRHMVSDKFQVSNCLLFYR